MIDAAIPGLKQGRVLSEHQYYEFASVDRSLTSEEIAELRQIASRADISSTRFVNDYDFDEFRCSPYRLMERYFDADLDLSGWARTS